ncbi:hypothetical protein [Neobacillus kokaensis]|uniref:DUF3953 domain-containing protein n=1 Tax=Neobacillus kokaensis TaxID=2759023 RepID=A0ABQ3N3R4_9BACI|nr:hypothetical protein [Neobacillus kokaensis]GHH98701.1 hypothetical protein AM1BK_22440 [Neobacillus kokaensis]
MKKENVLLFIIMVSLLALGAAAFFKWNGWLLLLGMAIIYGLLVAGTFLIEKRYPFQRLFALSVIFLILLFLAGGCILLIGHIL